MSPCLLFLIWTVSQVFRLLCFCGSSWFFLGRISRLRFFVFSCFLVFKNQSFFAPQGIEPLSVGSKVERSTEFAIWTRWKFCHFCFLLSFWTFGQIFSSVFFSLSAHRDFFLITVVYSEFPCFLAFSSVKKGVSAKHKWLKPLKIGMKYLRSSDWASGARTDACHLVFCF